MNRTIATVMVALAAVLAAIGVLGGEEETSEPAAAEGPSIAQVAQRVERVRELEFERLPRVRHVTGEQARADGLRELDREIPARDVVAEERLLKLLGLLPADSSLRELLGKALSDEVGGYYLPETDTLSIVGGGSSGLLGQITLAHELTHALEDQHFGLEGKATTGFRRDRGGADSALREGTATVVMVDYVVLTQTRSANVPANLRAQALEKLGDAAIPASSGLPSYMREQLVFPYAAGARLVNQIEGRRGWGGVNRAFDEDAPISTEQVMHPARYFRGERPVRVRVPGSVKDALPSDAKPVEQGDFGEFDTEQLLREANGRARSSRAAAGWGGGAFALWRLPGAACEEPCRERYVLVMRWTWDTERDAAEFSAAASRTARALGGVAARRGEVTSLVLAPRGEQRLSRVVVR